MKRVCIGIHVHAEPHRFVATLNSIRANTSSDYDLLILPDGPDANTIETLKRLTELKQLSTKEPCGAAACFNRLASYDDADVIVLLESGSIVGPEWIEKLLAALNANERNGLAGPTTNLSWNEQCVYTQSGGSLDEVTAVAKDAVMRFGNKTRMLEPLYSLADFCYAVRREVVETIGAADEAYETGPCWEMDYNIRAARAGWRGVWACSAYVYRSPFTARRIAEETRRFEANKRIYQDKFCGARLRTEKKDYRSHCRGDACPNFAPLNLIQIELSLSSSRKFKAGVEDNQIKNNCDSQMKNYKETQTSSLVFEESKPLVSCIMPTSDRRMFVPQAVRRFLSQDYPNKELLIVDDGTDPVANCVSEDERVRYIRLDNKLTVGAKRNFACEQARGKYIFHWDDDDWYPVWRVSSQVRAMRERGANLCGSSLVYYFEAETGKSWEYRYEPQEAAWVAGNTLAYKKSFWERNKFRDIQVGEDSHFVWSCSNESICDLKEPSLCVATVHFKNTSHKDTRGSYWHEIASDALHEMLGDEWHLYRTALTSAETIPLVSCIMPTCNRHKFIPLALERFFLQDYPNKELIIIDDSDFAIEELVQNLPGVTYVRLHSRISIGAKRNLACSYAKGKIIAHWDDDDWYSPDRLRYQVAPVLAGEADITGLEGSFVLHLSDRSFWRIEPELHQRLFVGDVHGGTLVYKRELLDQGLSYPEINLAEDAWLLHRAIRFGKKLVRLKNPGVFVYVRHGRNAWKEFEPGSFIAPEGWKRMDHSSLFSSKQIDSYWNAAQTTYSSVVTA